jgi:hypothetical protein
VRQNPWTMWDPEGLWAIADDAIAMGVGAVLGVAAQGVSDVWHGKLSGWEDYAASGVGGALAGEAALYTGGLASGAVYGASANLTRQGLRNLSGKQSGFDCNSLVAETAVCAVGGKLGEVAAPYLSRTVARAMQKESSVVAAGSTTALNAEVKATGDVLESTIAPAAEAGAANNAGKINVGALDFSTGANKAVFYSGPGNHGRAMAFAERTGATPIDLTPGGQYLNSLKLYDTMPAAQADAIWAQASQAYASGAQGKINLFVNGARPDRVFHTIEAPIIKANSNIYKQTFHY